MPRTSAFNVFRTQREVLLGCLSTSMFLRFNQVWIGEYTGGYNFREGTVSSSRWQIFPWEGCRRALGCMPGGQPACSLRAAWGEWGAFIRPWSLWALPECCLGGRMVHPLLAEPQCRHLQPVGCLPWRLPTNRAPFCPLLHVQKMFNESRIRVRDQGIPGHEGEFVFVVPPSR